MKFDPGFPFNMFCSELENITGVATRVYMIGFELLVHFDGYDPISIDTHGTMDEVMNRMVKEAKYFRMQHTP